MCVTSAASFRWGVAPTDVTNAAAVAAAYRTVLPIAEPTAEAAFFNQLIIPSPGFQLAIA
jgi:hypothetical protein